MLIDHRRDTITRSKRNDVLRADHHRNGRSGVLRPGLGRERGRHDQHDSEDDLQHRPADVGTPPGRVAIGSKAVEEEGGEAEDASGDQGQEAVLGFVDAVVAARHPYREFVGRPAGVRHAEDTTDHAADVDEPDVLRSPVVILLEDRVVSEGQGDRAAKGDTGE